MTTHTKGSAHHHLIIFKSSLIVQAKLSDYNTGSLPLVVLPCSHELLPSAKKNKRLNRKQDCLKHVCQWWLVYFVMSSKTP